MEVEARKQDWGKGGDVSAAAAHSKEVFFASPCLLIPSPCGIGRPLPSRPVDPEGGGGGLSLCQTEQ